MALRAAVFALGVAGASGITSCGVVDDPNPGNRWDDNGQWDLQTCSSTSLNDCAFDLCGSLAGALYLGEDGIAGTIPDSIGSLTGITDLHLWKNELTGQIPDSIGQLSSVVGLYLDQNELTGTIPPAIGSLKELTWLAMHYNELTGTIPEELTHATSLKRVYLDNNDLTGSLPDGIGNLSDLTRFAIWGGGSGGSMNKLRGSLPRSFGSLTNLEHFTISNNAGMSGFPLRKEHCQLIAERKVACSLTDIEYTACDSTCADYMEEPHGTLEFPTQSGGCGATCLTTCDYGLWEWQCTDPDLPSCYNTYNPCKNLHCERVEDVNDVTWTADRDYELVVLKSGDHYPRENIVSGQELEHYTGGVISHVIKCINVQCFERECVAARR